jgi:vitamin B12 transporter
MSLCYKYAPRGRVPVLLFLLFIGISSRAFSQDTENTDKQKEADIVVTATRAEEDSLLAPNFVTTITETHIKESGRTSVPEILGSEAGIALYDLGPKGSQENIWLRGASPNKVLILIDGVPTNNAFDGQMDFSLIPPQIIDRIEIVQGGMSILYGSSAVGGVINIITKKGKKLDAFFSGSAVAASYLPQEYAQDGSTHPASAAVLADGVTTALSFGHNFGPFSFLLSGNFDWLRNEYPYTDGGIISQRDNAGLLGGNAFASIAFPWQTGDVTVTGIYGRQGIGVPGSLSSPTPAAHEAGEWLQAVASLHESNFFTDVLSLDAKLSVNGRYRLDEPPSEESRLESVFAEVAQKAIAADFLSFIYGGNFAFDHVAGNVFGEYSRTAGSIFLSTPLSIAEVVRIYPAVRLDLNSQFGAELTYGLGTSLALSAVSTLKLSLAKSFRAPTLIDLYYPSYGNPDLKPERGWHADLGFALKTEKLKLESALFARLMTDEITFDPVTSAPRNVSQSFYPGWETQTEIRFIEHFFVEAAYTFIYSFDLSGGKTLADDRRVSQVPLHEAHLYLSYKTDDTLIRLGFDFQSEKSDFTQTKTLPAHLILNANFRQKLASCLTLAVSLENILNAQYQMVYGYPMPGISLHWGLEITSQ